jgi:hypothetical protein
MKSEKRPDRQLFNYSPHARILSVTCDLLSNFSLLMGNICLLQFLHLVLSYRSLLGLSEDRSQVPGLTASPPWAL